MYIRLEDPLRTFLDYEIRGSWWASLISNDYLQEIAGRYFARKVKRKFRRYQNSRRIAAAIIRDLGER